MPDIAKLIGLDKLINNIDIAISSALDGGAEILANEIRKEIPKGETGNAKDSVYVIPAKLSAGKYVATVVIGDKPPVSDYIWALWKGYEADYSGHPTMHFINWPDGPDELRGKDGYFHFVKVHHKTDPNDFIGRAINKSKSNILYTIKRIFNNVIVKVSK